MNEDRESREDNSRFGNMTVIVGRTVTVFSFMAMIV